MNTVVRVVTVVLITVTALAAPAMSGTARCVAHGIVLSLAVCSGLMIPADPHHKTK